MIHLVVWGAGHLRAAGVHRVRRGTNAGLRDDLADVVALIPVAVRSAGRHGRPDRRHPRDRDRRRGPCPAEAVAPAGPCSPSAPRRGRRLRPARWPLRGSRERRRGTGGRLLVDPGTLPLAALLRRCRCRGRRRQAVAVEGVAAQRRPMARRRRHRHPRRRHRRPCRSAPGRGSRHVRRGRRPRRPWRAEPTTDTACRRRRPRAGRPAGDRAAPSSGRPAGDRSCIERRSATDRGLRQGLRAATAGTPIGSIAAIACSSCASPVTTGSACRWNGRSSTKGCSCCSPGEPGCGVRTCVPWSPSKTDRWSWRWRTSAGVNSTRCAADEFSPELLDAVWSQIRTLHAAGIAHRALRAANIVVDDDGPVDRRLRQRGSGCRGPPAGVRPSRAPRLAGDTRQSRGRHGGRGAHAAGRRSRRGDAIRPTTRADRGDSPEGLEVAPQGRARPGRAGDRGRAGATGAARPGSATDAC